MAMRGEFEKSRLRKLKSWEKKVEIQPVIVNSRESGQELRRVGWISPRQDRGVLAC
jgi:hypothetical protein